MILIGRGDRGAIPPYLHVEIHASPCRRDTSNLTIVNNALESPSRLRKKCNKTRKKLPSGAEESV
jgi:hypothetical protein